MKAQPHIFFVTADTGFFFSHRLALALACKEAGYKVSLATDKPDDRLEALGIDGYAIPVHRSSLNPFNADRTIKALSTTLKRTKPDIIQTVGLKTAVLTSFALPPENSNTRLIHLLTGLGYIFRSPALKARLIRSLIPGILWRKVFEQGNSLTIFQNPDDRQLFLDRGYLTRDQAILIPGSGVDTERFRPQLEPEGPVTILMPARIIKDKGVLDFIAAAKHMHRTYPNLRFILAGNPDPANPTAISEAKLKKLIKNTPVEWIGHQGNLPGLISNSHIVCLPSYHEGMPLAVLEAGACARPVVTTDVPGCRSAIIPKETGILVPAGKPEHLAVALARLVDSPQLRRRLGRAARKDIEAVFSLPHINSKMLKIYGQTPVTKIDKPFQKQVA